MSDLTVREMTKKEAETKVKAFIGLWTDARSELLAMFEGKAHKALGYDTFEEFAQDRLGINVSDSTIKKHLAAARVERNLISNDDPKSVNITLLAALELNKLPADQQAEAYKELKTLESYGTHLPKQVERALRDIVTRRLNRSTVDAPALPPPAPIIIEPVETMKPRVPVKPIVPPTYDRGPEFDDEPIAAAPEPKVETPAPVVALPTAPVVSAPVSDTVSRIQYEALMCITKAFAGAVDRADKDAAIEARVDFKNFLKEWGP